MHECKCRECDCTWNNACVTEHGPCWWIEDDLCSACSEKSNAALLEVMKE